ncbi:MAG: endonuclease [Planctomycetota bacterium]
MKQHFHLVASGALTTMFVIGAGVASTQLAAQAPPGYYDSAIGLSGSALAVALHNIIDDHTVIPYSGAGFDTRDGVDLLDEDPSNPNNVILVYSGYSVPKSTWPDYNREHLWPQSLGSETGTPANSDMHILRACDADVNSVRSNKYYDECLAGCITHSEAPLILYDSERWEPRDVEKGNLARALFYMHVRYEGDIAGEPDLELGDADTTFGCYCMGRLSTLLAWHSQDPPDSAEILRNNRIFSLIQGNRNPFIDHPEWVYEIFGGAPPGDGATVWINEIHYDNEGTDAEEGVEVAGPAGTTLTGWALVGYNGLGGASYTTVALNGVIPNQENGFGAVWFPITGLQNGSPDGLALIDDTGAVVEFLSYEGSFTAVGGPAAGVFSVDIAVSEVGTTPAASTLQRTGFGSTSTDFAWAGPATGTRGAPNLGQDFPLPPAQEFLRGDVNGSGAVLIDDVIVLLSYLFASAPLSCLDAADVGDDGAVQINDPIFLLGYLFGSGALPPPPFDMCGVDTTPDVGGDLGCQSFAICP